MTKQQILFLYKHVLVHFYTKNMRMQVVEDCSQFSYCYTDVIFILVYFFMEHIPNLKFLMSDTVSNTLSLSIINFANLLSP